MTKMVFFYFILIVSMQGLLSEVANTTLSPSPSTTGVVVKTSSPTTTEVHTTTGLPTTTTTTTTTAATTTTTTAPPPTEPPVPQRSCNSDEIKFVYTPCDENGNRWRVQVPKQPNCRVKAPGEPKKGIKCSYSCQPGFYLDIDSQQCRKCSPGLYSLGDGKRFANWDKIPEGFVTQGFDTSKSGSSFQSKADAKDQCKEAKWKPKGHYLESNGSTCRSVLRYTVELVREGNVTFTVKAGDESSLFHVWIENDESCDRNNDYDSTSMTPSNDKLDQYFSVSTEWKTYSMQLSKGRNVIYFLAAHFSNSYEDSSEHSGFDSDSEKSVMIKEIVVRGFSSSYNCDVCPAGTFSAPGSSKCEACPENHFSHARSPMCFRCDSEQYSAARASKCEKRKPCTDKDYYMAWEPCKNGKTRRTFIWKDPMICSSTHSEAVALPKTEGQIDCPSCNPGQYNNGTTCVYCPANHYSSGSEECKRCPPSTRGAPGVFYKFWTRFPTHPMKLLCIAKPRTGCKTSVGWIAQDEYISTGSQHSDDAELLMVLTIPEFTKEKNEFKIEFSIHCPSDKCRFKIELMDADESLHVIRTYEGQTARTTYSYVRHSSAPARYRLVFEKKYFPDRQTYKYADSRLKIYYVGVTNVKMGGTQKCEKCAAKGENCMKCPAGNYIANGVCKTCPANTYLINKDNPIGLKSCKPCPSGTVSEPGSLFCHSNCQVRGTDNRTFDFIPLAGLHSANGQKRFTTKGYLYYHQFKLSFCGKKFVESECVNNATNNKEGNAAKAAICRSTIIPDNKMVVSAQSISIGQVLEDVKLISVEAKKDNTSTIKRSETDEIVFKFHSDRTTEVCKNGTFGIVRLVCDPYVNGKGKVELGDGKTCHSETCDGCSYIFTLKSKHACPACVKDDYEVINTACKGGVKKTHYVWKQPHVCVDNGIKPMDEEAHCTIFEKTILDFKIIILAFLVGGLLLAIIVLYLCYRNRTLTYNYSRLIDASQSKDGELPPAEMCALEDGEEEEEIVITKGKGGVNIMDRLRGIGKKTRKDFSEFETINLDSMHYSDDDEI